MITVEEAQARILADVPTAPDEPVPLADAYHRVLAEDLTSPLAVPPWPNSAMDGYAVRADDTGEEVRLELLEMVGAGQVASQPVRAGTAIGVMTGAPLPDGADAVVMVEDTDGALEGTVTVRGRAAVRQHVREAGCDIARGEVVLRAGSTLTPARVGLASSMGLSELAVRRRPVVAILTTGDEVVQPGTPLGPGQIYGSNAASLIGLTLDAGAVPLDLGNAPDDLDATREALHRAVAEADVVVTTGGVSVGQYDFVRDAVAAVGGGLDFWKVRMKPGKPLAFGHAGRVPLFGLPGNPVSCMVNFLQFVRPWIRTSLGDPAPFLPVVEATAGHDFRDRPGRAKLLRVRLERRDGVMFALSTGSQSSGVLTSMGAADGLLLVGIDASAPNAGDKVRVQVTGPLPGGATGDYGW